MKLPRRHFLHLASGAAAFPTLPCVAYALDYPTRPVHIVVGQGRKYFYFRIGVDGEGRGGNLLPLPVCQARASLATVTSNCLPSTAEGVARQARP